MKLRLALFAALTATAGISVAQTTVVVPANTYVIESAPTIVRDRPTELTDSPNPNKAQNSDMRTQSGAPAYYVYPTAEYPRGVFMYPPGYTQPTASMRNPTPTGITNTPNPNKTQNNGVPQQQ
jgi:hypothetical protein